MTRAPLPTRRPCVTTDTDWQGHAITVTVGLYADGTPGDVFADASYTVPPVIHGTLSDACVGMSIALQHGISPADLGKSLGTVPVWINGKEVDAPASPIGTILAAIADVTAQPMPNALPNEGLSFDEHMARRGATQAEYEAAFYEGKAE